MYSEQSNTPAAPQALTDRLYGDYLRRKERAKAGPLGPHSEAAFSKSALGVQVFVSKARELLAGVPWDKDKTESEAG